ncbi:MAG: type II toxin-antitoxin system VapC family toxin [Pseudonocardiales bacterium]
MIAIDTNILVYAHRGDAPSNSRAHALLKSLSEGTQRWAVPSPCIAEFLCVVTHPRVYDPPSTLSEALMQVDSWLAAPLVSLLPEGGLTWIWTRQLVEDAKLTGPRVYDARIAALCLEHGVRELWTADRDCSRFPALRTRNPLVDSET